MFSEIGQQHSHGSNVVRMPPTGLSTLSGAFQWRAPETLDAGDSLFWEGDNAADIFEVTAGVLRLFRIIADGRRIINGFLFPGDLIGLSVRYHYLHTAEAVTPAKVRRCSRAQFQRKMNESPDLRPKLFAKLCDEMAAAEDHMVLLRKSAEERLCSFLLMLAHRGRIATCPRVTVELPMSRQDIADFLGLTIETVSRTVTRLTTSGVIRPVGRHSIELKMDRLSLLAGDCDTDDNADHGRHKLAAT